MQSDSPLLPPKPRVEPLAAGTVPSQSGVFATRDHAMIRRWAARRSAQPATGEATATGPAILDVKDEGAGIRFNFPGASRFRAIDWSEWFDNFDRYELAFVFEEVDGEPASTRYRLVPVSELASIELTAD